MLQKILSQSILILYSQVNLVGNFEHEDTKMSHLHLFLFSRVISITLKNHVSSKWGKECVIFNSLVPGINPDRPFLSPDLTRLWSLPVTSIENNFNLFAHRHRKHLRMSMHAHENAHLCY